MGLMTRCPLTGVPCSRLITMEEKAFFLAEAEEPEYDRKRRKKAISEAIGSRCKIISALDEKGINVFTCKLCETLQTCAYGIADITQNNANVMLELGMMLALGKPTVILLKKGQEPQLRFPLDAKAIAVIRFEEYLDIIDQLRSILEKPLPSLTPPAPVESLESIQPKLAEELKSMGAMVAKEFSEGIKQAKLEKISLGKEKRDIPAELNERLGRLGEKLRDLAKLGFEENAKTTFMRGNFYYNQGKYNEALADYSRSLELEANDPTILCDRGITYARLDRYNEALAAYNRSLELRSNDANTLYNRGTTYARLGRYTEALVDYNRSLALRPNDPATLYNLACLFSLRGETAGALAYLEQAVKHDGEYRQMAKTDRDLANIRGDARFRKLVELGWLHFGRRDEGN